MKAISVFIIIVISFLSYSLNFNEIKKEAEQGDAEAQHKLGFMYHLGDGIEVDDNLAIYWFTKSAEQGNAWAQCKLGTMYYRGEGIEINEEKGIHWIRESAEQGNEAAQLAYGFIIYFDEDTDKKESIYWFKKCAEQGNVECQYQLGGMYYFGEGISVSKQKAAFWMNKALDNGHKKAAKMLDEWELWQYLPTKD